MSNDKDSDGKVTKEELPERMQWMVQRLDTNQDGAIDKAEAEAAARPGSSARGDAGPECEAERRARSNRPTSSIRMRKCNEISVRYVIVSPGDWLSWPPSAADKTSLELLQSGAAARHFSGIYPHLASFNSQGECGTGAVVPWAGKFWWVTYSPHMPQGSDDKLYAVDDALDLFVWPGSVGGTPANRFIHRESQQALIGPYVIDRDGQDPGDSAERHARTTDRQRPASDGPGPQGLLCHDGGRVLRGGRRSRWQVTELFPDANRLANHAGPLLPGYHGKGAYSGQGAVGLRQQW